MNSRPTLIAVNTPNFLLKIGADVSPRFHKMPERGKKGKRYDSSKELLLLSLDFFLPLSAVFISRTDYNNRTQILLL